MPTFFRYDTFVKSSQGPAIPGAQVWVTTQPANLVIPPTPLALIYADPLGLVPITQPILTDGYGHGDFYALPGFYTLIVAYNGVLQQSYPDQCLGGTGAIQPLAQPFANDFYIYTPPVAGAYANGQEIFYCTPVRTITIPAGLIGSTTGCRTAPTGNVVVTLNKNGVSVGTVSIAAGHTTGTFSFGSTVTFNGSTDTFQVVAPASADATFSGFWLDIQDTRSS